MLAEARRAAGGGEQPLEPALVRSRGMLRWATPRALPYAMRRYRYISVTGLPNVIRVFDDVERGKLKDIDFIECYACWAGCGNGNLTVDNVYVGQAKLQTIMAELPDSDPVTDAEVERRYPTADFSLDAPFKPRVRANAGDLRERVRRVKEAETVLHKLPGYDCGLCGAPTCATLAHDVAAGEAAATDCVLLSRQRLQELRRIHPHSGASTPARRPRIPAGRLDDEPQPIASTISLNASRSLSTRRFIQWRTVSALPCQAAGS